MGRPVTFLRRPRHRFPLLALVAAMVLLLPARRGGAEDEPPLATVETDPGGQTTRLVHAAERAQVLGDDLLAAELLGEALDAGGDVLVPLAAAPGLLGGPVERGLAWPARRIAEVGLSRLDAASAGRTLARARDQAARLWTRARAGDAAALAKLTDEHAAQPEADPALLVRAEIELERGALAAAADTLRRWRELFAHRAAIPRAEAVVRRLVDVLVRLEDVGALQRLRVELGAAGDDALPLVEYLAVRASARRATRPPTHPAAPPDPGPLRAVWRVPLGDEALVRVPGAREVSDVRAGAHVDGEVVIVHAARTVRCLEVGSGLERWQYPARSVPRSRIHDPAVRYAPPDRPVRAVVPGGDLVFVVMGDPPASGAYKALGQRLQAEGPGEQPRAHLLALERATGRLVWRSGAVDEDDPFLGDPDVACQGPPHVDGDRVYACFGRVEAGAVIHVACFARTDGRLLWRTPVAVGSNGRAADRSQLGRFDEGPLLALPWGAPPALADGELCIVPHAGFAAGLDAATGRVRWVRALPRFPAVGAADDRGARRGFGAAHPPRAVGDVWLVAAHDAPDLLALERRSGKLRWQTRLVGDERPTIADAVRHLVGIVPDAEGQPLLRFVGEGRLALDPRDGALVPSASELAAWTSPPWMEPLARPLVRDDGVAVWRGRAWQSIAWGPAADPDAPVAVQRSPPWTRFVPSSGHLLAAGPGRWLVVGDDAVALVMAEEALGRVELATRPDPEALTLAAARGDVATWSALALRCLAIARDAATLDLVERSLGSAYVAAADDGAAQLVARVLAALPQARRIDLLRNATGLADLLAAGGQGPQVLTWLEEDLAAPTQPTAGTARQLLVLEASLDRGELAAARAARAQQALALATDDAAWRAVARRFPGTAAAARARARQVRAALTSGEAVAAAAALADLRLDPPREELLLEEGLPGTPEVRALLEADLWLDACEPAEARDLLALLEGRSASGRRIRGRDRAEVLQRAARLFATWPGRDDGDGGPVDVTLLDAASAMRPGAIRGVRWLAVKGPGAARWAGRLPYVRGIVPGVFDLESRTPVELPADDLGWFGGALQGLARGPSEGGIRVANVVAGEPADASGIVTGDRVMAWNGAPILGLDDFMTAVARSRPGERIAVDVRRRGRAVLETFEAGRRPPDQGTVMVHGALHVEADGRALYPSRLGLDWIEATPPRRRPLWRHEGAEGLVERVVVRGRLAYVLLRLRLGADRIVAVDLGDGRERWSQSLPGRADELVVTGSALVVGADDPAVVRVFDAFDGTLRLEQPITPALFDEFRTCWTLRRGWAAALGQLYTLETDEATSSAHLVWYDTTTGQVRDRGAPLEFHVPLRDTQLTAGAFAAVPDGPHGIVVLVPPLTADGPVIRLRLDGKHLNSDQTHHGPLDGDARLFARGRHLAVLRTPWSGEQPVTVSVYVHDFAAGRARASTPRAQPAGPTFSLEHIKSFLGGARGERYVVDAASTHEGLLLQTGHLGATSLVEVGWVAFEPPIEVADLMDANRSTTMFYAPVLEGRRDVPAPVVDHYVVPTDAGARLVRLERPVGAASTR